MQTMPFYLTFPPSGVEVELKDASYQDRESNETVQAWEVTVGGQSKIPDTAREMFKQCFCCLQI